MKYPSSLFAGLYGLFLVGLFLFLPDMAHASNVGGWVCSDKANLNQVFCGITSQFRFIPQVMVILAYALAVYLAMTSLLQLKQYGDDPSRSALPPIIARMVVAVLLISLPWLIQIFVTTLTGADNVSSVTQSGASSPKRTSLGSGVSGKGN